MKKNILNSLLILSNLTFASSTNISDEKIKEQDLIDQKTQKTND